MKLSQTHHAQDVSMEILKKIYLQGIIIYKKVMDVS